MKLQTFILLALLLSFSSTAPGSPFLPPFLIQSQPELLLPPQVVNFGSQIPGAFLPLQQNLPQFLLPTLQQETPTGSVNPNNPNNPLSTPNGPDPAQVSQTDSVDLPEELVLLFIT
ncbi:hypothetical protein Baya_12803 [Bagarius yarrelli]|uniref:Apin n=1 Tax=Bagarius yarrelli TaxID=175774 RepID=A0A556V460_BAGYA|nr:hypothetical protein Baya_12803 [Bagarius yarrelli]